MDQLSLIAFRFSMRFSRYVSAGSDPASGDGEIRTLDPLLARQVLSQLSYTPTDAGLPFFQGNPYILFDGHLSSGLKWTRTTDLTLIRRAL